MLNVMMPVPKPLRFTAQEERLEQIAKWIQSDQCQHIDVFIFIELIPIELENKLRQTLHNQGYIYHSIQRQNIHVVRSGIVCYSKFPITNTSDVSYNTECEGSDCLADKNMLYVELQTSTHGSLHLFMTHLHAWHTEFSQRVRIEQLTQLSKFITLHNIPSTEPVLICGDFNIDKSHNQQLLEILQGANISTASEHYSIEPTLNPLVGLDNIEYYTNEQYPNGCVNEYWQSHECVCCPREWIDYAVISTNHLPIDKINQKVIIPRVDTYDITLGLTFTPWQLTNTLSDHFPILIEMDWTPSKQVNQVAKQIITYDDMFEDDTTINELPMRFIWAIGLVLLVIVIWVVIIFIVLPYSYRRSCSCSSIENE
jgi:endonuclease/exonuclease/phosphatase family metal-dependent hydrolase